VAGELLEGAARIVEARGLERRPGLRVELVGPGGVVVLARRLVVAAEEPSLNPNSSFTTKSALVWAVTYSSS